MNKLDSDCRAYLDILNKSKIVFLDTETTGLDSSAEVCQIAVIDLDEKVLFYELIRPFTLIPEEVSKIHGITDEKVADKNSINYFWGFLCGPKILRGAVIFGYNVSFDIRLLLQSISKRYPHSGFTIPALAFVDVMEMYRQYNNISSWMSLITACHKEGIELDIELAHDSKYDAILTCRLFKKVFA